VQKKPVLKAHDHTQAEGQGPADKDSKALERRSLPSRSFILMLKRLLLAALVPAHKISVQEKQGRRRTF
jgi:hypothetical protein